MPCHTTWSPGRIYSNDLAKTMKLIFARNEHGHRLRTTTARKHIHLPRKIQRFARFCRNRIRDTHAHTTHAFSSIFIHFFPSLQLAISWWRWIAYGSNMRWNLTPKQYVCLFCFVIMFEITIVSVVRWWNRLIQKLWLTRQAPHRDSDSGTKG